MDFDNMTMSQLMQQVLLVKTNEEAKAFLTDYSLFLAKELDLSIEDAYIQAKKSIGYHSSYYTFEARLNIESLFDIEHPIFGKASEMGEPTNDEALECSNKGITLKQLRENYKTKQYEYRTEI